MCIRDSISLLPRKVENPELKRILRDYFHIRSQKKKVAKKMCIRDRLRLEKGWSQRELADILQLKGLDVDKNAIQRIEARKRFVTDIELVYFAKVFEVDYRELLEEELDN